MPKNQMAIDELIERARESKTRRDDAAKELAALVRSLDGLSEVDYLDDAQRRELAKLRAPARRPPAKRRRQAKRS